MPEASNAVGFLGELDRIVYQKVREGKSALRIALEINDSQYQRSLEELRQIIGWNAHGDDRCKLWNLTTIKEVYAVKILWFRTAYEKYNGRNTDEVFRRELGIGNVYMNNDYELSEKLRNFKEREPFPLYRPYGAQNFLHGFREYVWFHASENHTTNDLYGVVQRAIGLDETERFNPQNYQEGEYQFAYKMLERLNDPWHRGDDFREVVGKFCDKECNIAEEAEWIQKIVRNFPRRDFANCDFYMRWHPGVACMEGVVCWDKIHLAENGNITISCTGMNEIERAVPKNGRLTQPVLIDVDSVVAKCRLGDNILSSFEFENIDANALCEGIWFRHGRANDSLWERATSLKDCNGEELRKKRMIPVTKKEVLIVSRCGVDIPKDELPSGVCVKGRYHTVVKGSKSSGIREYDLTLLGIQDRSVKVREIRVNGFVAEINACGLKIVGDNLFECVGEYEDCLLVESSQSLRCEGKANGEIPEWSIDNNVICTGEVCVIPEDVPVGQQVRISCRAGNRVDRRRMVVLPSEIFNAINGEANILKEWRIVRAEKIGEEYIDAAIEGIEVISIVNPSGEVCVRVARQIDESIWWLQTAAGYDNNTRCCQNRDLGNENVDGWFFAFPYESKQCIVDSLTLDRCKIEPEVEPFAGYLRVRLSSLSNVFGPLIPEEALQGIHTLRIAGRVVADWTAIPHNLTFVKTQTGLAVYVPEKYNFPFVGVAFFPDNIDVSFVTQVKNICEFETSQIAVSRLIPLENWKNEIVDRYHTSEVFLGLRLSPDARESMLFKDFLDSDKFQLLKVNDGDSPLCEESLAIGLLTVRAQDVRLLETHPYRCSRVWAKLVEGEHLVDSVMEGVKSDVQPEDKGQLTFGRKNVVINRVADYFSRKERAEYAEYDNQARETLKKVRDFDSDLEVSLQVGVNPLVESTIFSEYCRGLLGANNGGVAEFIQRNPSAIATPILVQFLLENNYSYANLTHILGLPQIRGLGVCGRINGAQRMLTNVQVNPNAQGRGNLRLCFGGLNVDIVDRALGVNCRLDADATQWADNFCRALGSTLGDVSPCPDEEIDAFEELFNNDIARRIAAGSVALTRLDHDAILSSWTKRLIKQSVLFVYNNNDQYCGYPPGLRCVILGGMFLGLRVYVSKNNGNIVLPEQFQYDYNSLVSSIYLDADRQRVYGKVFVYSMCFILAMLHCLNFKDNVQ